MAAANTNYGNDMLTHLTYAVEFLKSKGTPKTLQDVLDHLSLQHTPEQQQQQLAQQRQQREIDELLSDASFRGDWGNILGDGGGGFSPM